jgi:hypothetical protein
MFIVRDAIFLISCMHPDLLWCRFKGDVRCPEAFNSSSGFHLYRWRRIPKAGDPVRSLARGPISSRHRQCQTFYVKLPKTLELTKLKVLLDQTSGLGVT